MLISVLTFSEMILVFDLQLIVGWADCSANQGVLLLINASTYVIYRYFSISFFPRRLKPLGLSCSKCFSKTLHRWTEIGREGLTPFWLLIDADIPKILIDWGCTLTSALSGRDISYKIGFYWILVSWALDDALSD